MYTLMIHNTKTLTIATLIYALTGSITVNALAPLECRPGLSHSSSFELQFKLLAPYDDMYLEPVSSKDNQYIKVNRLIIDGHNIASDTHTKINYDHHENKRQRELLYWLATGGGLNERYREDNLRDIKSMTERASHLGTLVVTNEKYINALDHNTANVSYDADIVLFHVRAHIKHHINIDDKIRTKPAKLDLKSGYQLVVTKTAANLLKLHFTSDKANHNTDTHGLISPLHLRYIVTNADGQRIKPADDEDNEFINLKLNLSGPTTEATKLLEFDGDIGDSVTMEIIEADDIELVTANCRADEQALQIHSP